MGTKQYIHILPSFLLQRGSPPKARTLPAHFPGMPVILFNVTFKVAENNPMPFVSRTERALQPLLREICSLSKMRSVSISPHSAETQT